MPELSDLQNAIGVEFRDRSLLSQALVHRSYLHENPDAALPSNERLEFLGDAVLGFVVAEEIFRRYPQLSVGELTKLRAELVRGHTLDRIAMTLDLGDYLLLGRGEEESGGRRRPRKLGSALEAVIGAVLLDQGLDTARGFILKLLSDELGAAIDKKIAADHKSRLQQIIQAKLKAVPAYHTIDEQGPDHAKEFTVEVQAGGEVLGTGRGRSKRSAEMAAARAALEKLAGG